MFLSTLYVNVGDNPDRPRPGRLWLRNRYRVHQRLAMAFPSQKRKDEDPDFLQPYHPDDFGSTTPPQLHIPRTVETGFLFRVDPLPGNRAVILVQSAMKPDWDYAFANAKYLLRGDLPIQIRVYDPSFQPGQKLRFRLEANPTKKVGTIAKSERERMESMGLSLPAGRHGRRVPADPSEWIRERADQHGFRLLDEPTIQTGWMLVRADNGHGKPDTKLFSARYDGTLEVTDPIRFKDAVVKGIGPAKGFGFGLLSVVQLE
ncbi:MAG: type I-E CRISPR-associated protein Cas6/Cse3/CasE [Candidatus Sumerlaea chitinivorans]|nr:type I-E CRISPR-associated protein Cas6/Cse3/CasE [Candidatus Sumerlaea chitinivorans]